MTSQGRLEPALGCPRAAGVARGIGRPGHPPPRTGIGTLEDRQDRLAGYVIGILLSAAGGVRRRPHRIGSGGASPPSTSLTLTCNRPAAGRSAGPTVLPLPDQPLRQSLMKALRSAPFSFLSPASLLQDFIFICCLLRPSLLATGLASAMASFSHFFMKLALAAPASFLSAALASQPGATSAFFSSALAGAAAAGLASAFLSAAGAAPWAKATPVADRAMTTATMIFFMGNLLGLAERPGMLHGRVR